MNPTFLRLPAVVRGLNASFAAALLCLSAHAPAQQVPIPCVAGVCGTSAPTFVTAGAGTAAQSGNTLNVTQTTDTAIFNWQSFNIGPDGRVNFAQPSATSVALNRIFDAAPSRILGVLNANGRVYLLNRNGIVFGAGAQVNVGGLVASSLDVTPAALEDGIARAARSGAPAFAAYRDAAGNLLPSGAVRVLDGARLTANGGQVLLFGPEVSNEGSIRTPDGQTILAAGQEIYLTSSTDPNLRGLLVEVSLGGTVTNGRASNSTVTRPEDLAGQIVAERGNVTLAGLAVNQLGRISATTSVRANGSVRLLARDGVAVTGGTANPALTASNGGSLSLGARSETAVTLVDDSTERTVDVNTQPASSVVLEGRRIRIGENARVVARGGSISAVARADPRTPPGSFSATPDDARIFIERGATLDAAGASAVLPVERNLLTVELRGTQLANSPAQRDGPLRCTADSCTPVVVDIRASGTRADGSTWQGTPIADLSGDISNIARTVTERSLSGGSVSLQSSGDVIVSNGASIDVSGGQIRYLAGTIATSQLLGADGRVYDIANADPDRRYLGVAGVASAAVVQAGVSSSYSANGEASFGAFETSYLEGRDAGSLGVLAPRVIFDGRVLGRTVVGRYQRLPAQALGAGQIRPFNQVPLGAELIFGNSQPNLGAGVAPNYLLGSVTFADGLVLPTLLNDAGEPFDAASDLWPSLLTSSRIRPQLVGGGAASRLSVFSNGRIELPGSIALAMPTAGSVSLTGSVIDISGSIDAPSGNISMTARTTTTAEVAGGVRLADTARLTARGAWINDDLRLGEATASLHIAGGNIALQAQESGLELVAGSVLDVSGGGWRRSNGTIVAGRGGSIALTATPTNVGAAVPILLGAELRGFALTQGATLSITANRLCIAATDCAAAASTLWLSPERLGAGGFADLRLAANLGGLEVLPGTLLALRQTNLEFSRDPTLVASTANLASLTRPAVLNDLQRRPVNLTLSSRIALAGSAFGSSTFAAAPSLTIGAGASIDLDPAASVTLRSNTRMIVDGTITTPGGNVSLQLDSDLPITEFLPSQAIWLGQNALLNVRGVPRITTSDLGERSGQVLDGGSVSIVAQRGYIVTLPGSRIDVSGAAAEVDVRETGATGSTLVTRTVGSRAGSVTLLAAEGMLLNGSFAALGGTPGSAGGSLNVTLDTSLRNDPGVLDSLLPIGPRRVVVSQLLSPLVVAPGTSIPAGLNGQAFVSVQALDSAGFDFLALAARSADRLVNSQILTGAAPGEIELRGPVDLALRGRLSLDAAGIRATSGDSRLAASAVTIGHSDPDRQQGSASPTLGSARLTVEGNLIQLVGTARLFGLQSASFRSATDIQLRGVQSTGDAVPVGALLSAGDLEFVAQQIYPTTLTDYLISVSGNADGRVSFATAGGERRTVLSAGGRLTVSAPEILQAGVLRAPFGTISLDATRLTLAGGSLTSTSADGALIPFGTTQGGFDWTFQLPRRSIVYGAAGELVPQQRVLLAADELDFQAGATVDVSAGGDLLAYEFIPGTTGTRDVLGAAFRPNQFAILPAVGLEYAPFDPGISPQSALQVGDSVYLAGGGGLAAGFYTLLPARYALLPGAYLVTAVSGYQDLAEGSALSQLDGSTVVAGYRTIASTSIRDSRTSGFAVRAGTTVQREARYVTTRASAFFASQYEAAGVAAPRLAGDAGVLSITAGSELTLDGQLRAVAAMGGRGAGFDLSGDRLEIVATTGAATGNGGVQLAASRLSALGAESILLGGSRVQTATGTRIDVAAESVTIGSGSVLSAPELLLAARDLISIGSGARIEATGAGDGSPDTLLIAGDSALVRVAGDDAPELRRTATTGATGSIVVAEGASLVAGDGSITLDATRDARSAGLLSTSGVLSLGAARITLGDAGSVPEGLLLDRADLAALQLRELRLRSGSTIDLFGEFDLDVDTLALDATGIRAGSDRVASVVDAAITARSIRLGNSSDLAAGPAGIGTGSLQLAANELLLGSGSFRLTGFTSLGVDVAGDVFAESNGNLQISGAAQIAAARIAAAAGVDYGITASGELSLIGSRGPIAAPGREAGLGARFEFSAERLLLDTLIATPAGVVNLRSTGGDIVNGAGIVQRASLQLGADAAIDVAGRVVEFDGVPVAAHGGSASLVAERGGIRLEQGSRIDANAGAVGDAGRVELRAAAGAVDVAGALRGGEFLIDAQQFGSFAALNRALNAGGFAVERNVRLRGLGDLRVESGAQNDVTASIVRLTADRGSVLLDGNIRSQGALGGQVTLSASERVALSGRIDASALSADVRGGRVELMASTGGSVLLSDTASIDVSAGTGVAGAQGPRGGRVTIRVDRSGATSVLDADASNDRLRLPSTAITGAERVNLEAFAVYTDGDGVLSAADTGVASAFNRDSAAFMTANAVAIRSALGWAPDSTLVVRPGVEVRSAASASNPTGNLRLASDWNLNAWRYGDAAGVLTLRAAGNLQFDNSLSDGFDAITGTTAFNLTSVGESWSYRLIGGADLASSAVLAVQPLHAIGATAGTVRISNGTPGIGTGQSTFRMVRTGTGDIDVAAARNFELGNRASVLYSAGRASIGIPLQGAGNLGGRSYPVDGGDISIVAQGDVRGAQTNQLITDWLWRTGRGEGALNESATGWTINFQRFSQNVGALGGGDLRIRAGGDIDTLSAVAPSIGRQVGGRTVSENRVDVLGRGTLDVAAGDDIRGGVFYVGNGVGRIRAGGDLTADAGAGGLPGLNPVLAVDAGSFDVSARGDVAIEAIVNFSLLPQAQSQLGTLNVRNQSYFSSYGSDTLVDLTSIGGRLALLSNTDPAGPLVRRFRDTMFFEQVNNANSSLRFAPPRLAAAALSGDLELARPVTLYPSAQGNLALFARNDLLLGTRDLGSIIVSDADPDVLPSVADPAGSFALLFDLLGTALTQDPRFNAAVPLASPSLRPAGAPTPEPIRLVAANGSILHRPDQPGDTSLLYFSRAARVIAGEDIRDLSLTVQHVSGTDVTTLIAGRDLIYSTGREENGAIAANLRAIAVDGPGRLDIEAGRNVDLQASSGITTRGDLRNPALADSGAAVSVLAGVGESGRNFGEFISRYLAGSLDLLAQLREFVMGAGGGGAASSSDALTLFRTLSAEVRREFLDAVFPSDDPASGEPALRVAAGATDAQRTDYLATLVGYESRLVDYVNALVADRAIDAARVSSGSEALATFTDAGRVSRSRQAALLQELLFSELRVAGRIAAQAGDANGDVAPAFTALETLYPGSNPNVDRGEANAFAGDIRLFFSRIYTLDGGGIELVAPGGGINVGLASPPAAFGIGKRPDQLGIVAQGTGSVQALAFNDFEVNESRVFAADGGSILVWSTRGDIDAGRGAKTAISAPPPQITFDDNGFPVVTFPAALTGSGIQTLATTPGREAGDVDLFAPRGVVNAGDAGIVCRNCTIFATAVIGANNIQVGGVSVGVPSSGGGPIAGLSAASNVAGSASNAAAAAVGDSGSGQKEEQTPLADSAIGWLEVFVEGFGEEVCKPNDEDCLRRNRKP